MAAVKLLNVISRLLNKPTFSGSGNPILLVTKLQDVSILTHRCIQLFSCNIFVKKSLCSHSTFYFRASLPLADNTGRFSHIGKATWLQVCLKADKDIVSALQILLNEADVTGGLLSALESFIGYIAKSIRSPVLTRI